MTRATYMLTMTAIALLLPTSAFSLSTKNPLEAIMSSGNTADIQKTANLLSIFVSKSPGEESTILEEASEDDICLHRTAALYAIRKACSSSESKDAQLRDLNRSYQKLCRRLDTRFKKILYGPDKGAPLPTNLTFAQR